MPRSPSGSSPASVTATMRSRATAGVMCSAVSAPKAGSTPPSSAEAECRQAVRAPAVAHADARVHVAGQYVVPRHTARFVAEREGAFAQPFAHALEAQRGGVEMTVVVAGHQAHGERCVPAAPALHVVDATACRPVPCRAPDRPAPPAVRGSSARSTRRHAPDPPASGRWAVPRRHGAERRPCRSARPPAAASAGAASTAPAHRAVQRCAGHLERQFHHRPAAFSSCARMRSTRLFQSSACTPPRRRLTHSGNASGVSRGVSTNSS